MDGFNYRVPGMTEGEEFADKQICLHADHHIRDRIPVTIAPNTGALDKGTVLGSTTADGLYRPVRRSAITTPALAADKKVVVPVADLWKFKQNDSVAIMKADGTGITAVGNVTIIASNGTITFQNAVGSDLNIGDYLFVQDGSEKALLILGDSVGEAPSNKIGSAFIQGKFLATTLIGIDPITSRDLRARVIPFGKNADSVSESIYVV